MGYVKQDTVDFQKIFARTQNEVEIFHMNPNISRSSIMPSFPANQLVFSKNGNVFCSVVQDKITVYDTNDEKELFSLALRNVVLVDFSPLGGFLVTLREAQKDKDGNFVDNLEIWNLRENGKQVISFQQIKINQDHWPLLHWMEQDNYFVHITTNTLHMNTKQDNFQVSYKVHIQGIQSIAGSPGLDPAVAIYIPESKGSPAQIELYSLKQLLQHATTSQGSSFAVNGNTNGVTNGTVDNGKNENGALQPLSKKSFYRSNEVVFRWSSLGNGLLVLVQSYFDPTNTSYYGEQKLFFFSKEGKIDVQVPLPKDGFVHDAQWSPRGDMFCVISGLVPSKACVYNERCEKIFDLGSGPYNTIKWNAHSRFLVLAGFGSLPGDVTFFDRKADGKFKHMGTIRNPSTYSEWSPCGRFFLTATTTPRLRVDNKFKILTYYGELVHEEKYKSLYAVKFRPFEARYFPDRPSSPQRILNYNEKKKLDLDENGASGNLLQIGKAYVPPHLRNKSSQSQSKAPIGFSLAYENSSQKSTGSQQKSQQNSNNNIPGAEVVKNQKTNKNTKKRENKKKSKQDQGEEEDTQNENNNNKISESMTDGAQTKVGESPESVEDREEKLKYMNKDLKKLQIKLQQIEQLKKKRATGMLEQTQVLKIQSEMETLDKIRTLENLIQSLTI